MAPAAAQNLFKLEFPQSVGIFSSYEEAQRVVDYLADQRFPVENLCIVGTDLKSVERVLGRRNWGTVIWSGVQSGISTGLMVTLLMWIFMPDANIFLLMLAAMGVGIGIGVVMAALSYWMSQGKRDFNSVSQTVATKYEVLCEHKLVEQAKQLITQIPGIRAAVFNAPVAGAPAYAQAAAPVRYPTPAVQYPAAPGSGQYHPAPGPYPVSYPNPYAYPVVEPQTPPAAQTPTQPPAPPSETTPSS
jgi:hypothetical protein